MAISISFSRQVQLVFLVGLMALAAGLGFAPAARAILVGSWSFNESSGTVAHDDTGVYDGVLSGGAVFVAGGADGGNAVSLATATNSFVTMGTSFPGFTSGDFSLVAWVKSTATAGFIAAGKHEAGSLNGYFLSLNNGSGYGLVNKAYFYASNPPTSEPISTTTVNDDQWHQLVGTYTVGGTMSIYVDGAPVESTTASQPMNGNGAAFMVGGINYSGTPTGIFDGLVDDVQVYSNALSGAEVQNLFVHPGAVPEPAEFALLAGLAGLAGVLVVRRRRQS